MARRCVSLLMLGILAAGAAWAQGIDTQANRDDWEEINFDFDSSVLVDGFPSLLRLAELLRQNPGHRVQVEGHADAVGSNEYNQRLGLARANTVRDFLLKYGAQANQITVSSRGETAPRVPGGSTTFTRTDEARFMNRRVTLTVTDAQGNRVGDGGGAGDAIRALQGVNQDITDRLTKLQDCCDQVLKRLDRLDEIARMLKDLADQNAALRRDLDALRQGQQTLESRVNQPPPAPPKPPSAAEVANEVRNQLAQDRQPKFQLLGANVGADDQGNIAFSSRGRFFGPLGEDFGIQAQAEYYYIRGQREGQFDLGLVDRLHPRFQAGLFASFKHVSLTGNQSSGTLGQGAVALDYIFSRGRIGAFATKAFRPTALINRANEISPEGVRRNNVIVERYLSVVDQVGLQGTIGLMGNVYAEGNAAYLRSTASGNRMGGTLRFVFPMNDKVAFTVEGGVNETFLPASGTQQGRAVVGVQFGNFLRPKDYLGVDHAIPMEVPRVRYEVLERRVRTGNDPPVADAGPDMAGVAAGPVTLDGSNSYDPDGDPITYQWVQEGGAPVSLSSPTSARTTFNAALGQTYIFRLTVKDDHGGQDTARVRITTRPADRVSILFFIADPRSIQAGQSSTLSWRVINADTVNISGIGNVPAQGTAPVSPTATTTYTLTARNNVNEETATATVVVTGARFLYCFATPSNIREGETATLNWSAPGATSVTINQGIGTVGATGNLAVSPRTNTTYTLTANGPGSTDSCSIAVSVGRGDLPRIIRFSAQPTRINSGETSTLFWVVENADTVTINNGVGNVSLAGTQDVSPAATTVYTLTATNITGSVTATATVNVNVIPPPRIVSFTANPPTSNAPGSRVVLTCVTEGATHVNLAQGFFLTSTATLPVFPTQTTTYTCVATNAKGETATQTLQVPVVAPPGPPGPSGPPPTIVFAHGEEFDTIYRLIRLDASQSFAAPGNGPLTFFWTVRNSAAAILNPTSATPDVQLGLIAGIYVFDLTVTDAKGNTATKSVTVNFKSQGVP
jgi:LysM repeat protein